MLEISLNVKDFEITSPNQRFNLIAGNTYAVNITFSDKLWDGVADLKCRVKNGTESVDVDFVKNTVFNVEIPVNADNVGIGIYSTSDTRLVTAVKEFEVKKSILSD